MTVSTIAGRYSRDTEIGRGGMGAVWRGTDQVLGRTVALKRVGIAPGGATPDALRAEREARLAARLNDPHVVSIFDLVDDGTEQWLVMEYVEGTDLAGVIRDRGALTPDEVAPLLAQVASALAAAHSSGIVHRDVKPSNILVKPDGAVKLSDFGIARTEADAALTQTGLVTGSPAYLSPEVASGQLATPASDVWSLGATLYHALEGRPPYDLGDNLIGGLYRIVHEAPPLPADSGWLAPMLAGTMTHQPADRWTAAQAQRFLATGPTAVVPTPHASESTQLMDSLAPPQPEVVTATAAARVPTEHRGHGRRAWWAVAVALLVVVALTGWAVTVGFGNDTDGDRSGQADGGTATSPGTGSASTSTSASPGAGPTADGMSAFLSQYLANAVSDRTAAYAMLTSDYQQRSGGKQGYAGFWGSVTRAQLLSSNADPDALTISYTYRYVRNGRRSAPETHQMTLDYADGQYLIADQT